MTLNLKIPYVSIIIPVKNEGIHIQNTLHSIFQVKSKYSFEVIVIDDASTDGCCDFLVNNQLFKINLVRTKGVGVANAKNIGAQYAKGQFLIFCDAHIIFEDYWIDQLIQPILDGVANGVSPGIADTKAPNNVGYGQSLNEHLGVIWHLNKGEIFPTAVLPGGCCAISKYVFNNIGGFDRGFRVWGFEDVEISMKLWLFGYTCYIEPKVKILHVFREQTPYQVSHEHVYFNMLRMAYNHFNEERIERCRKLIGNHRISSIEPVVLASGVLSQRHVYFARRKRDDDWYMNFFNIPF
ncbi:MULTISPECIES: glycosyltransferase family 2 protein [Lysinibacillus]|uniref:Glycosyltransferase n=1 Tax=Lysinibacillus antri TaxID=2498145 RepID=A0A432LF27_9BACI|nr:MULTISPECIES: glycosyltransferase [Lysinibacillus]RUL54793.1 glycosyltransferase [Lysinibacillus antri]TSI10924.1 glycosyltransferase [Lysinibacillus sp. BW-2-10]